MGSLPAGGATNQIVRIFHSWIMAASISLRTVFSSVWTISASLDYIDLTDCGDISEPICLPS